MHLTVSILVPVHNTRHYISRCLDSIVKQDYKYIQIVVIDDGSTDGSYEICRKYAARYSFIEVYSRHHKGVGQTRKDLLQCAFGDYVLFVDSDDWIESNMVSSMMRLVVEHNADIAMCGLHYGNHRLFPMCLKPESGIRQFNRKDTICSLLNYGGLMNSLCNKLIKGSLYKNLKYSDDITVGEDLYMIWQIIPKIEKVVCVPIPYYHYENTAGSLTRQSEILNMRAACDIWLELERESCEELHEHTSLLKRRIFFEVASYSYLLVKEKEATKATIDGLIHIMKRHFPVSGFDSRQQLMKIFWGTAGIIGGYRLMRAASCTYNRLKKIISNGRYE